MLQDFILFIKLCNSLVYQRKELKYKKQIYKINDELWEMGMPWRRKIIGLTLTWCLLFILLYGVAPLTSFYRLVLSFILFLAYFIVLFVIRTKLPQALMNYLLQL